MVARVKICCIGSVEEARLAVRYGAAAVGLVSEMPSGPGTIFRAVLSPFFGRTIWRRGKEHSRRAVNNCWHDTCDPRHFHSGKERNWKAD